MHTGRNIKSKTRQQSRQ